MKGYKSCKLCKGTGVQHYRRHTAKGVREYSKTCKCVMQRVRSPYGHSVD